MTIYRTETALRQAARQMVQGLAAALPAEETPTSPALTEELILLGRRTARGQLWRRLGQRAAMIALTAVLAFGAVLAVSPQARAAVGRWLFLLTENRALYQFLVEMESSRAQPGRTARGRCCIRHGGETFCSSAIRCPERAGRWRYVPAA